MNSSGASLDSRRIRAEAASWVARLHGPDRNAEIEAGLKQWLAEDPRHERAFELATEVWQDGEDLPAELPRPEPAARVLVPQPHRRQPVWRVAAAVGIVVLGLTLFRYFHDADTLTTSVGEQRTVTLEDGSRVELNTNSRLRVKYDPKARRIIMESGEAYFDVAHQPARPFIVQVGDREVSALGTEFVVRRDGAGVSVTLLEGRVAVSSVSKVAREPGVSTPRQVQVLKPGERLRVDANGMLAIDLAAIEKATAWQRGQLVFEDTPLSVAVKEFNRYSRAPIELGSPELTKIRVGGTFRVGDAARFAQAVAESNGLAVMNLDGALILTRIDP